MPRHTWACLHEPDSCRRCLRSAHLRVTLFGLAVGAWPPGRPMHDTQDVLVSCTRHCVALDLSHTMRDHIANLRSKCVTWFDRQNKALARDGDPAPRVARSCPPGRTAVRSYPVPEVYASQYDLKRDQSYTVNSRIGRGPRACQNTLAYAGCCNVVGDIMSNFILTISLGTSQFMIWSPRHR